MTYHLSLFPYFGDFLPMCHMFLCGNQKIRPACETAWMIMSRLTACGVPQRSVLSVASVVR